MGKTIIQAYRDMLKSAEFYSKLDSKDQQNHNEYSGLNREIANAYFECASWLEETEEVNPTD